LGTGCSREERKEYNGVCEQGARERRGKSLTVFGNRFSREERAECDGVWEQGAKERRGQSMKVFGNKVLERGVGRV